MLQRQPSSITTALPFYFTSTAMQYSRWSYKQTYSTRSLVREPLVIARYPSLTTKRESFHVTRLLVYFSMLSVCQHLNRLLVAYPLVSISACQHLIRLLASYELVIDLSARQQFCLLASYPLVSTQYLIRSLVFYPLVRISTCYHLICLLLFYPVVSKSICYYVVRFLVSCPLVANEQVT